MHYYYYLKYIIDSLIEKGWFTADKVIPINEVVTTIPYGSWRMRPHITFGTETQFTNKRCEETFLINLQFFSIKNGDFIAGNSQEGDMNGVAPRTLLALVQGIKNHIKTLKSFELSQSAGETLSLMIYQVDGMSLQENFDSNFESFSLIIEVKCILADDPYTYGKDY